MLHNIFIRLIKTWRALKIPVIVKTDARASVSFTPLTIIHKLKIHLHTDTRKVPQPHQNSCHYSQLAAVAGAVVQAPLNQ